MSKASDQMLLMKVNSLREQIREINKPEEYASNTGMDFVVEGENSFFTFKYFTSNVVLPYPELIAIDDVTGEPLDGGSQAVISYYGFTATQSKIITMNTEWISFSELADGRFYNQAFQGYTGNLLAKQTTGIIKKKDAIFSSLQAESISMGDLAFQLSILQRVSLALVIWLGDEDFPPSCKILFNRSVNSFLPTDACAIIGSMLTHRILKIVNQ